MSFFAVYPRKGYAVGRVLAVPLAFDYGSWGEFPSFRTIIVGRSAANSVLNKGPGAGWERLT